jgi:hypothetical protein
MYDRGSRYVGFVEILHLCTPLSWLTTVYSALLKPRMSLRWEYSCVPKIQPTRPYGGRGGDNIENIAGNEDTHVITEETQRWEPKFHSFIFMVEQSQVCETKKWLVSSLCGGNHD